MPAGYLFVGQSHASMPALLTYHTCYVIVMYVYQLKKQRHPAATDGFFSKTKLELFRWLLKISKYILSAVQ